MTNLLLWCDEKISYLKQHDITFKNGLPVIPENSVYRDTPKHITTFPHRNSIPLEDKRNTLLCSFMPDHQLLTRLTKVDSDLIIFREYAGICGFDLSPSIYMLLPRQKFSILVNAVFNSYCALHGVKILPNARLGEMKTFPLICSIPTKSNIISSTLGCRQKALKSYSLLQLTLIIESIHPPVVFVYGNILGSEANYLFLANHKFKIIVFPDVRSSQRNGKTPFEIIKTEQGIKKISLKTNSKEDI